MTLIKGKDGRGWVLSSHKSRESNCPKNLLCILLILLPQGSASFLPTTVVSSEFGDMTQVLPQFLLPFNVSGWEWVYMSPSQQYTHLQKDFFSIVGAVSMLIAMGWRDLYW